MNRLWIPRMLITTACAGLVACGGVPTRPSQNPPGTPDEPTVPTVEQFRLSGTVTEPVGIPVTGAMVMVGAGTPNALGTGTDSNGRYELTGVKGTQTLEISAPGYATVSRTITVDRNMTTDVEIVPTQTPAAIAGRWRVTFEPNSACSSWPTAVGARTYQADVTQQRTRAVFTFSGATFEGRRAFDLALVVGNDLRLEIGTWGESGLIEHTSDGQFVRIRGVVTAVVAGSRIEGDLDGILDLAPTLAGLDQGTSCAHAHHHVTFTR